MRVSSKGSLTYPSNEPLQPARLGVAMQSQKLSLHSGLVHWTGQFAAAFSLWDTPFSLQNFQSICDKSLLLKPYLVLLCDTVVIKAEVSSVLCERPLGWVCSCSKEECHNYIIVVKRIPLRKISTPLRIKSSDGRNLCGNEIGKIKGNPRFSSTGHWLGKIDNFIRAFVQTLIDT